MYAWNTPLKATLPPYLWDYAQVTPCGSQVTCNPPPGHTSDCDYLVHVEPGGGHFAKREASQSLAEILAKDGWTWEGDQIYTVAAIDLTVEQGFMSWRKDRTNLIVVGDDEFARKHRLATRLCVKLNLPNRDDRIAIFQAVLYGECDVYVGPAGSQL